MDIKEKIDGMLYGIAIGDTLGKGTEFMSQAEVHFHYPEGLKTYSQIIRDAHRSQWENTEWTNDTEVVLRIGHCIIDNNGVDLNKVADKLLEWNGEHHSDMVSCMICVLNEEGWRDDPLKVARKVWTRINRFEASNEALGRALLAAVLSDDYMKDTQELVLMTHADSRCASSACVIAEAAHIILYEERIPEMKELTRISDMIDNRTTPYVKASAHKEIRSLELDDPDTQWYTRKTMGAALWALWHTNSAAEALYKVVDEGGDADTNASLAMGLAGLRYGISSFPHNLVKMLRDKDRIDELSDRICKYIENKKR